MERIKVKNCLSKPTLYSFLYTLSMGALKLEAFTLKTHHIDPLLF